MLEHDRGLFFQPAKLAAATAASSAIAVQVINNREHYYTAATLDCGDSTIWQYQSGDGY